MPEGQAARWCPRFASGSLMVGDLVPPPLQKSKGWRPASVADFLDASDQFPHNLTNLFDCRCWFLTKRPPELIHQIDRDFER